MGLVIQRRLKQNGCFYGEKKMLRGFPSPFSFMSHMETAKATENYAITFRKSEAVFNSFLLLFKIAEYFFPNKLFSRFIGY